MIVKFDIQRHDEFNSIQFDIQHHDKFNSIKSFISIAIKSIYESCVVNKQTKIMNYKSMTFTIKRLKQIYFNL